LFFNIPVSDFHCGLRGFKKESILKIGLLTTGMEFASEMVVKASLFNLKMAEVPTVLSPDGRSRPPHLRTWRDGWRHLRFLFLYSPRWLFLYPGVTLFIFSTIIFGLLLMGPIHIGSLIFDVHTIAYFAAFIIVSIQVILFYIMSKIYAINQGLIPVNKNFNNLFNYFNLERGLALGMAFVIASLVLTFLLVRQWKNNNYGQINNITETFRLLMASILVLVIGMQLIFSSFMLSILGVIKRERFI
jgi:hypothetical protein